MSCGLKQEDSSHHQPVAWPERSWENRNTPSLPSHLFISCWGLLLDEAQGQEAHSLVPEAGDAAGMHSFKNKPGVWASVIGIKKRMC